MAPQQSNSAKSEQSGEEIPPLDGTNGEANHQNQNQNHVVPSPPHSPPRPHNNNNDHHHHHHEHHRRELHTAESIMEYMHEMEPPEQQKNNKKKQTDGGGGCFAYRDYLKAQKHLKQQSRRGGFDIDGAEFHPVPVTRGGSRRDLLHRGSVGASSGGGMTGGAATTPGESRRNLLARGSSRANVNRYHQLRTSGGGSSGRVLNPNKTSRSFRQANNDLSSDQLGKIGKIEEHNNEEEQPKEDKDLGDVEEGGNHKQEAKEEDHGDDHHHDDHHHSLSVPWYCRPVQRQRWDDDQVLPHINWGDLFFDLFYVAAAYNLGGMLISSMNPTDWPRGVVYFIGIFGPLYNIWENDVIYSSRYTLVDYAHRFIAVVRFLCVSFAVLSIKPISLLGDKTSAETLTFTLSLFLESLMHLGLKMEVYWYGEGDRTAIQNHTSRRIISQFLPATLTYMVAAIIAGYSFFSAEEHGVGYKLSYDKDGDSYGSYEDGYGDGSAYGENKYGDDKYNNNSTSSYYKDDYASYNTTDGDSYSHGEEGHFLFRLLAAAASAGCEEKGDGHRSLAGGGGGGYDSGCSEKAGDIQWSIADVPMFLCMAIYIFGIGVNLYARYTSDHSHSDIREKYVPNNIDYMIHRYGEWIMLMIGESILSLLIVETTESRDYYAVTVLGCLTVIILQMLKFESEPSHADGHALWRSMLAASLFSLLIQILSMGLIAFGVSYKIMLTNVFQEEIEEQADGYHRYLAALPAVSDHAVASLFCGALSVVLLSLEMMLGTHKGVTKSYELLFHDVESLELDSINWPLMTISLFKLGLIAFTATLSQWAEDPVTVSFLGLVIVTGMSITRIVGWGFVHHEDEIFGALNFVADQTMDMTQNVVNATMTTVDFGQNIVVNATGNMVNATDSVASMAKKTAKKTLKATASLGMDSSQRTRDYFSSSAKEEDNMDTTLWDTAFDAVVVTDRIGIIKYVNKSVLKEFLYESENELIGNNVTMLVGGGEARNHHMYMDRFNKNESMSTTLGTQRQLKARRKDETEFTCVIGIKEIPNTGLLVGYIRPTAELETADQKDKEDYHIDDTSFDSIIMINPEGLIVDVNLTALTEFGFASKDELVGKNISLLVGGNEADYHDAYLANFIEAKKESSDIGKDRILYAKRKDAGEFPCVVGIKRAPGSENLIGYIRNMTGKTPEDTALKEKTKYLVDDTSFDAIIVTDAEGTMLQLNATAVEEFGYRAKAELVGQNIRILVGGGHAKHHDKYMKRFQKQQREDTAIGKQRRLRARRKDGKEFNCVIGIKGIPGTDCLIGYIRSTEGLSKKEIATEYDNVSNISTHSKVAQSADGASLASGKTGGVASNGTGNLGGDILDSSFDAIIVTDFRGIIRRVNQTVLDIFRYESKDQLIGKNISMLVGGKDAEMHDSYLERFQKSGKTTSQIGKQRVLYSKRKDGTEFPSIIGIKRTPKNDGLVGWIRDMSNIAEQETRSSIQITNMKMLDPVERLVDDKSFDAIIVTDAKGVIKRVNKTTVNEFRYASKEELIGKNVSELVGGKVSARSHDKYLRRFRKAGKTSSTIGKQRVLKSKRKDGSEFRCIIGINKIEEVEQDLLIGYIRNLEATYEVDESEKSPTMTSVSGVSFGGLSVSSGATTDDDSDDAGAVAGGAAAGDGADAVTEVEC